MNEMMSTIFESSDTMESRKETIEINYILLLEIENAHYLRKKR